MRCWFIVFAIVSVPRFVLCQVEPLEPIIFENEFRNSFHTKPKLDVKLDNRFSFIRNNDVRTIGVKVGLNFDRKFKVGLGFNRMLLLTEKKFLNDEGLFIPVELEYYYFSPYLEYVYYNSKRWEFSLSTQLGFGEASYVNSEKQKVLNGTVISYEPAMLIDYKIIRWFAIGTGLGYRFVYYKNAGIEEKFSSPEAVIKLKIYLGEIVRTLTGKELKID
jgi:hypothetical protein